MKTSPSEKAVNYVILFAFAAFALGFIAGEEQALIRRNGPWTRVSLSRGHVLVRGTVRNGLTAVRTTGAA